SFTVPTGGLSIGSVSASLARSGTPTDNIQVDIYLTDGAGKPVGALLGSSNTVAGSTLTTAANGASCLFTFATPVPVSPSTQYAAVIRRTGAFDTLNYYIWPGAATDVNAAEKSALYNSSTTTWGSVLSADLPLVVTINGAD